MTDILISLARAAILVALNQPDNFDLEHVLKTFPVLEENAAVFVTLTTEPNEQLRGCIGSLQAYRPLYKDIIANAQAAALRDPRFTPLTLEEFNHIKIEVSILSKLIVIVSKVSSIKVRVIISKTITKIYIKLNIKIVIPIIKMIIITRIIIIVIIN